MRIIQYLKNLKLSNFLTIDEYQLNIRQALDMLKLNTNYTVKEVNHKENEAFLNGLNDEVAMYFAGQGVNSTVKMVERSNKIENQLIIALQKQSNIQRHNEERKPANDNTRDNGRINKVQKYYKSPRSLKLKIFNETAKCLLDTGYDISLMGEKFLTQLTNLKATRIESNFKLADNSTVRSREFVHLTVQYDNRNWFKLKTFIVKEL